jgi:hypothetical protein
MKRVAILGFDGFRVGEYESPANIEKRIGANTGNLLFWSAIKSLFSDDYEYLSKVERGFPSWDYVNQTFDVLIKPAANHLDPKILHPELVNYLSKLNIPILVLGLGAQLSSVDEIKLAKSKFVTLAHCTKFIDVLNDKCPVVCVRGQSSAALLSEVGYRGIIEVTGCPSQTLSMELELGKTIGLNLNLLVEKLQNNSAIKAQHLLPSQWDVHLAWTVDKVRKMFGSDQLIEVQQSGGVENFIRYFDRFGLNTDIQSSDRNAIGPIMFFNVESWAAAISAVEFSIGTRIHGNILATQLGIPCLVISHDVRVNELSDQLALPWVDLDEFKAISGRSNLCKYIRFDAIRFDKMRIENLTKFRKSIEALGLKSSAKLRRLTTSQAPEYQRLREIIATRLPADALVMVVSKGDEELLKLGGHRAGHFPQAADGNYAGYYPADSKSAIAHLEELRAKGAGFLLIPKPAFWWLEYYSEFKLHLEHRYRTAVHDEETCLIFDLAGSHA